MYKKETYTAGSISKPVSSAAHNRLKNVFGALNAATSATRILVKGGV